MPKAKITVLKRMVSQDVVDEYLEEEFKARNVLP